MDEAMTSEGLIKMLVVTLLFDGESTPNPTEVGPQSGVLCPPCRPPDLTMTTREQMGASLSPLPVASARFTRDYWAIWEGGKKD